MLDAGEDTDFTDYSKPHVYRVEAYLAPGRKDRRGMPTRRTDPNDIEVTDVFRINDDGSETELPHRVWDHAYSDVVDAVIADLSDQYDMWDGGA